MLVVPNHTQIPNAFIDECILKLNGGAVKVFLCICRKTIGWHKLTDKISYSQLMQKTGLSVQGTLNAIKELESKDLIIATRVQGKTTTYEILFNSTSLLNRGDYSNNQSGTSLLNRDTKETLKETNKRNNTVITTEQQDKKDKEKELGKKAKHCLDYYYNKHVEIRKYDPIIAGGRDMKLFKEILRSGYEVDVFERVTDYFFAYSKRANFTTRALYNSFDTLYGVLKDKEEGRR